MRAGLLYLAAALCIVLIVSIGWWTRDFMPPPTTVELTYTVQPGDTVATVAESFELTPESIVEANDLPDVAAPLAPGQELAVPTAETSFLKTWGGHGLGLLSTVVGVFLSFWLARLSGVLPKHVARQILGISLVLGVVSYASAHAVGPDPVLTPQYVFSALKDGFMWAAAFPMVARALGIRDEPPPAPMASPVEREAPPTT